jgi:hypothetical protein
VNTVVVGRSSALCQNGRTDMRRLALIALALASPALLLAFLVGGRLGGWLLVVVGPVVPVALMARVAVPSDTRRFHAAWLAAWLLSLEVGSIGLVALAGRRSSDGLPPATVVMLVALGVVPLVLVPLGHAWLVGRPRRPSGRGER